MILFLGIAAYLMTGYALAFGNGNSLFGTSNFFILDVPLSSYSLLFFQVNLYL